MPGREATDLLLQAANAAGAEESGSTLASQERMALRYFSRANRFSRGPIALAEFQSIGVDHASRIVGALVERGLVVPSVDGKDPRENGVMLTESGRAILASDPYEQLLRAINTLDGEKRDALCHALRGVLSTLADRSAHWYLNSCRTCSEFTPAANAADCAVAGLCKAFNAEVSTVELDSLCMDYSPSSVQE